MHLFRVGRRAGGGVRADTDAGLAPEGFPSAPLSPRSRPLRSRSRAPAPSLRIPQLQQRAHSPIGTLGVQAKLYDEQSFPLI